MSKVAESSTKLQKTGGRQKGTPNKDTTYLMGLLDKNKFDPVEFLIKVANNDWKALGYDQPTYTKQGYQGIEYEENVITMDHRIDAAKSLVGYIYPKRKSVEITSVDANAGVIMMSYNPQALKDPDDKS